MCLSCAACISLSDWAWHSAHACISVCTIDGGKEGTSVCAENKWESERSQPERQDLWNSSHCLSLCTVWIMSNSKQTSVPRWFCIWKDASLTRSGSFFCVCALSDSTFHVPELVVQIKKLSILRCKKISCYIYGIKKNTGSCGCLKFTVKIWQCFRCYKMSVYFIINNCIFH